MEKTPLKAFWLDPSTRVSDIEKIGNILVVTLEHYKKREKEKEFVTAYKQVYKLVL